MQPAQAPRGPMDTLRAFGARHRSITIILGMALVTAVLPIMVLMPGLSGLSSQTVWISSFSQAGVYVLLAMGLNVVVGMAGLLDLGYAAFFAIGAYAYAYGSSSFTGLEIPFWIMLVIGALVAAVFGLLLGAPTLRLRGDYLAIVTLGFGEIVPVVFKNADKWTNGTNGIAGISRPEFPGVVFGALSPVPYYITIAALITIAMVLLYRLQDSRLGRSWQAIREDELAAASNGINTVTAKLLAFALGASTAGLAGVFNASSLVFVSPDQFLFQVSFTILAMVVLGGIGNIWGVALGAFIIYTIQSVVLKQLNALFDTIHVPILSDLDFTQYQFLLYGFALVGMMLLRPEGLFPNKRRAAELHGRDELPGADVEGFDPEGDMGRGDEP
jgi:ABC-type branched-subunit amino acid transport system permease subunit